MTRTANNDFIDACLEFDRLMAQLAELREHHFGVEGETRDWGEAGSVRYANERLRAVLQHYGPRRIKTYESFDAHGKPIRVTVPE